MKYKLQVRQLEESDLNSECPFLPDMNFKVYLNALVEDIENMSIVSNVVNNEGVLIIDLKKSMTESEFKERMEPIFRNMICQLKFESLEII